MIYKEIHFSDERVFPLTAFHLDVTKLSHKLPPHYHDEMEIIYFKEGGIIYEIDEIPYKIDEECIIIFPPNTVHSGTAFDYTKNKMWVFIFNLSIIESSTYDFCSSKYISPIKHNEVEFPVILEHSLPGFDLLKEKLMSIYKISNEKPIAYELDIKSEIIRFFSILYKNDFIFSKDLNKKQMKKKQKIKTVFSYIHKNYKNEISRNDLLEILNIGEAQFTRFFKDISGNTFVEYLNSYRVIKSAQLLIFTEKSITDIAYECGFQDLSYYIKVFNKQMAMSPNKYRKNFSGA